jgi:hypothetical protein
LIKPEERLAAGGLVEEAAEKLDPVSSRLYRHPALGNRAVVRLCSERLAPGEDLTLEFYGFGAPETRRVGWQIPKGLGFPAWALIYDPERAAFALEVVKELSGYVRAAGPRPGFAKEGMDAIGTRLSRSVPHFLPSFYEECSRAFLETSNTSYAAQYFNKARESEKVHALQIDEDLRRQSFLEFALAGAVTVKSLTEYTRELERAYEPRVAYEHARELCLRRTLGGMPPWASMLKDLARLSKGAGLNVREEEETFLKEILSSSCLARSPIELWTSARSSLKTLCKDPVVRGALLNLFPKQGGDTWFELLDEWGVSKALTDPPRHGPDQPEGGAAVWLARMSNHFRTYQEPNPNRLYDLVRRMEGRLKADAQPVELSGGTLGLDVDLIEQLCSLQIPLRLKPAQPYRFGLAVRQWAASTGPEHRKDPIYASREALLSPLFAASLESVVGTEPFETVSSGMQGWREPRRRWLESKIERLENQALPGLRETLDRLEKIDNPRLFASYRELYARLSQLRVAPALARSLHGGSAGEWVWPAFSQALLELDPKRKGEARIDGLFPYLVAWNASQALAVGPDGIVDRHDLVTPGGSKINSVIYVAGQFLVRHSSQAQRRAYWSGASDQGWDLESYATSLLAYPAVTLPDGGVTFGGRALYPGDQSLAAPVALLYDGSTCWRLEYQDGWRAREFDPRTGAQGRLSLPSFLENYVQEPWKLDLQSCSLFEAMGSLVGFRARSAGAQAEIESLDGRRWAGTKSDRQMFTGLIRFPGSEEDRLVCRIGNQSSIWDPSGSYAVATRFEEPGASLWRLPPHWWSLLRPRDPAASAFLRELSDQAAEVMLQGLDLPQIKASKLHSSAQVVVAHAGKLSQRLEKLVSRLNPEGTVNEPLLITQINGLLLRLGTAFGSQARVDIKHELSTIDQLATSSHPQEPAGGSLLAALGRMIGVVSAPKSGGVNPKVEPLPLTLSLVLPGHVGALAWLAVSRETPPDERAKALELLHTWSGSALLKHPELFRKVQLKLESKETLLVLHEGPSLFLLSRPGIFRQDFSGLEFAPDGEFRLPAGAELLGASSCQSCWDTAERLKRFVELARSRGVVCFERGQIEAFAGATGLSYAESCFVCNGLPYIHSYEANFLPADVRERWGLKAAEAKVARDNLKSVLPLHVRLRVYTEAVPEDPSQLWDAPQLALERLAAAWNRAVGRRQEVSPEILAGLTGLRALIKPDAMIKMLDQPDDSPLARDGRWTPSEAGAPVSRRAPSGDPFSGTHLLTTVVYGCHLLESLPAGHPLRAQVAEALTMAQQRLRNPDLLLWHACKYLSDEAQRASWLQGAPGRVVSDGRDSGGLLVLNTRHSFQVYFRPAQLSATQDMAFLNSLVGDGSDGRLWAAFLMSRQPSFPEMIDRLRATPVPVGQYEANPLMSAPALVADVQSALELDPEAAILYLQLLTLAQPTARLALLWNGWKAETYRKAAAALVKKGIVLEAKRARAGRNHFLPGGWEELKSPELPLESWKLPLYGLHRVGGVLQAPLGRILPLRCHHRLFEAAWARVRGGDAPGYESI